MPSLSDEVRQFCSKNHLRLNKDLGQHFLIDQEILDKIIQAADIQPTDHIVEIGPGIGILTAELLKRAKKITAIELDEHLIPLLKNYTGYAILNTGHSIVNENALHVPMPQEPYKIVANIPYHITSPLLRHVFLESQTPPTSMTLLIQREVAEKICDPKDAGLLTILVGLFGEPRIVTTVPPKAFFPPPKVDSAVLHIDCFSQAKVSPHTIEEIFRLTKAAFGQKRKMLSNTLGAFPGGMERLKCAQIDPKRRPQTLSVEEWIHLAQTSGQDSEDAS
ncbi:MAG: 16S rRNA (adenine(1518)-N(6)/adenine(1519)-N(6))-dimethyltransferase RsmA [Candidatus Peribacteraceae bacterium]